jgi:hypothetical protein
MPLALSNSVEVAWWASLGGGLIIVLAVWALLESLRRTVDEVDRAVDDVWTMGKRLAGNTQTTHMLGSTKELGVELLEEVERHRALARKESGG